MSIQQPCRFTVALLVAIMLLLTWPGSTSAAILIDNEIKVVDQFKARVDVKYDLGLTKSGDSNVPQFAKDYPRVGAAQPAGSKTVEVLVKVDKSGRAYYLVTRNRVKPAVADIMTGKGRPGSLRSRKGSIEINADIEAKVRIELSEHDTDYNVFMAVQDLEGNFSRIKKVAVKTPPDIVSNNATVTSAIYTVSAGGTAYETIANVPFGTSKGDFLKALTKGHLDQEWDDNNIHDPLQSGDTLVVTAPDKTTQVTYTIQVNTLPEIILADHVFGEYQVGDKIKEVDFATLTSGGSPPYAYNISEGKLPVGFKLEKGILSGMATQAGEYSWAVTVTDSINNTTTNHYTIRIIPTITSFVFKAFDPDVIGIIDQRDRTISLTVPSVDVTRLVPSVQHTGSSVTPASGVAQDFTDPVVYTVKARNDTWAGYTVIVTRKLTVPVTSITVSGEDGETRVRQGRTLQMIATVKPNNATDKKVIWKVIDGTGSAYISSQGLLTAYSPGTVTVKAYANDNSGVVGSKTITITRSSSSSYYWDDWYGDDWVDSNGGKIKKNGVTVIIPRNAVDSRVRIDITKASRSSASIPSDMKLVSDVFNITKSNSDDFDRDVTIILPFDEDKIDKNSARPSLYWWNSRRWIELDNIDVDWSDETVSGKIDHFTRFAALAEKTEPEPVKPKLQPETKKPAVVLNDIYGHWAERQIRDLVGSGVINGYPDGCFRPDQTISRAEFATMIVKTLGLSSSGTKLFADTQGHWGRYTIAAAYEAGIVSGYDFNRFGPDDPITREQMAVMIVKAAGLSNQNSHLSFVDSRAISTWARSAVARAAAQKIIMGYPDNTFRPANPATRAEAVSIFARAPF